ncbi:uncharacterized protein BJ171DRAFT_557640 [Polychytrium aggregatum]|uniref:uncharacterized protein n=1 Tax=Polychytrium aggregatum TaxID=110093 RepID=UPI0022FDF06E|nr:uncharacterized protein BJ171DRAFT_557640 [Polychytrium aggregatum]KAI9208932.1 hypothetical protein BJ171DRAFT_557640 [Polychytrium aggregatum]
MQLPHEYIMCGLQHPTTLKCSLNAVQAFHNEWWRAMSLYTPLNAIMVVIFRGSALFKDPLQTLSRLAVSILRSSLFLTCYVTTAWTLPCYLRRFSGTDRQWHYYINGILAGMMVLIEVPGRRLELALYCMPRALESFWNCGVKWKWWKNIPGGEAIYFCFATGVLMTFYQNDPAIIHDGYRKVMVRFLGIN